MTTYETGSTGAVTDEMIAAILDLPLSAPDNLPEDGGDPDQDRARFVQELYQTVHLAATHPLSRDLPSPTQVTARAFLLVAELLTDVIDGQARILAELQKANR